jgi:TolB-like protein/class 3 adenylate cyclase
MADLPVQRRLAAILAADLVGYSGLMETDEAGTLARLKAMRSDVLDPIVARFAGRIFKTMGDGFLIEFQSAASAVDCAVQVQRALAEREVALPTERRLRVRIGISLGDVILEGDDLYGNGVNVAARMQALAEPGDICISRNVHEHVRHSMGAAFEDLGFQPVKNLSEPVRSYRVVPEGGLERARLEMPRSPGEKPSIAVLPFENMSGDPEQDYFADGMVQEIITGLSRIHWLTVIARNSTFAYKGKSPDVRQVSRDLNVRYLLEGSVRKAGQRVRIATQLIDAEAAGHLWAERFEGSLADVFDVQDQITAGVVGAIEPTLRKAEIARSKRKRPDDLDAYDLYLRAVAHMYEVTPEARVTALEFIGRALRIDPAYAEPHGVAAWCYFARSLWEGGLPEPYKDAMLRHARAVQSLQTEDATTLAHAAIALALATRDYDTALEMIDRAIAINPNSVHAHGHGSVINTWAGNYERSIALAERALRLSPFDPLGVMPLAGMAGARMMKGEYEAAVACARRALQIYPTHTPSFLILIVSLVRLGRVEEARATGERFMQLSPGYRIIPRAPVLEYFVSELRQAGLPG